MSTTNTRTTKKVTSIGRKLRKFRMSENFTQETVATLLNTSRGFVSNIENGFAKPSKATKARINDAISFYSSF